MKPIHLSALTIEELQHALNRLVDELNQKGTGTGIVAKQVNIPVPGPKGNSGDQGPIGQIGPSGPQGEIGLTGPTGQIGPSGPNSIESFTTDDLLEGDNLYYTNSRVQGAIDADTSLFKADGSRDFTGTLTAPDDLHIQCGTEKTVVLDEPVWVDIDFPIIIRSTGPNIPSLTTLQGNISAPQWQVNDFNVCEGQELIHKWAEGTPLYWHLHMVTNGLDATNRYVRFEVEYCWVNVNGVLSSIATINSGDLLIPANTTSKTMMLMSIGNFTPTGGRIGGHVFARLRRIASTGTAPSNDPWITMLQAHITVDTIGSRRISAK